MSDAMVSGLAPLRRGFFIFYFRFLQKYIFTFEIYMNIPGRPAARRPGPGRPVAGRQGLLCKNFCENICAQVPGGQSPGPPGRPAAGRPALAARLQGDRFLVSNYPSIFSTLL